MHYGLSFNDSAYFSNEQLCQFSSTRLLGGTLLKIGWKWHTTHEIDAYVREVFHLETKTVVSPWTKTPYIEEGVMPVFQATQTFLQGCRANLTRIGREALIATGKLICWIMVQTNYLYRIFQHTFRNIRPLFHTPNPQEVVDSLYKIQAQDFIEIGAHLRKTRPGDRAYLVESKFVDAGPGARQIEWGFNADLQQLNGTRRLVWWTGICYLPKLRNWRLLYMKRPDRGARSLRCAKHASLERDTSYRGAL